MTAGTRHVPMLTLQSKFGPLIVVKQGRFPFGRVMAVGALRHLVREEFRELSSVDVLVTVLAFFRRLLEIDIDQLGFQVGRFVTVNTSHRAVRPRQWKRSRTVVELIQFAPRFGRVACLATHRLAVLSELRHSLLELPVMDVFVAARTGEIVEVIWNF